MPPHTSFSAMPPLFQREDAVEEENTIVSRLENGNTFVAFGSSERRDSSSCATITRLAIFSVRESTRRTNHGPTVPTTASLRNWTPSPFCHRIRHNRIVRGRARSMNTCRQSNRQDSRSLVSERPQPQPCGTKRMAFSLSRKSSLVTRSSYNVGVVTNI